MKATPPAEPKLRAVLCLYHLLGESVGEDVACVKGNIARCENVAVIDGGRTVYAVGSPLLQILAYLLMVMVGVRAGILELRETASLFIRATRKAVQGEFDGADQPEAAQSLVAVRRVGLRERGRYEIITVR